MAAACIPGGDSRDLQRNDRRIHQRDQPAHRPDETLGLTRAPVHILGPVNSGHFFRQFGGQQLCRRTALALHRSAHIFALGVSYFFKSLNSHAGLLRKSLCRSCLQTVLEGNFPGWPCQPFLGVTLIRQHVLNQHSQSPRRRVSCQLGRGTEQTLAREQIVNSSA